MARVGFPASAQRFFTPAPLLLAVDVPLIAIVATSTIIITRFIMVLTSL